MLQTFQESVIGVKKSDEEISCYVDKNRAAYDAVRCLLSECMTVVGILRNTLSARPLILVTTIFPHTKTLHHKNSLDTQIEIAHNMYYYISLGIWRDTGILRLNLKLRTTKL